MQLILTVNVTVTDAMSVTGKSRQIVMLPFTGTASGSCFCGRILPQAVDTQTIINGVGHLSARYLLEGTDAAGNSCRLFIENNGDDFSNCHPVFTSDSPLLQEYENADLTATVTPTQNEVIIKIYSNN